MAQIITGKSNPETQFVHFKFPAEGFNRLKESLSGECMYKQIGGLVWGLGFWLWGFLSFSFFLFAFLWFFFP